MAKYAILLDSTCNLTPELLKEFDLDYIQMSVSIEDKIYPADLAWGDMTPHDFYSLMKAGKRPYTQAVNESLFTSTFEKYLNEGMDILYIGCSGGLSASVRIGAKVAKEEMAKHPDHKIICIDPCNSGMGQGLLGIYASEMRAQGKSIDEVAAWVEQNKLRSYQWGTTGNLTYLKNAGRVKASAAFFGNIIGIKPIILSDDQGNNVAFKKVRGRKAALDELVNLVVTTAVDPEHTYLSIDNADCPETAEELKKRIEEKIHFKRVFIVPLGPILGASCGPDTVIVYHMGGSKQSDFLNK